MNKKFICTVCGYVHEGNEAPEKCPLCGAPKSKFKELAEDATLEFVTEHQIGIAKEGTDEEMIKGTNRTQHFAAYMKSITGKKNRHYLRVQGWKTIFQANGLKNKLE